MSQDTAIPYPVGSRKQPWGAARGWSVTRHRRDVNPGESVETRRNSGLLHRTTEPGCPIQRGSPEGGHIRPATSAQGPPAQIAFGRTPPLSIHGAPPLHRRGSTRYPQRLLLRRSPSAASRRNPIASPRLRQDPRRYAATSARPSPVIPQPGRCRQLHSSELLGARPPAILVGSGRTHAGRGP